MLDGASFTPAGSVSTPGTSVGPDVDRVGSAGERLVSATVVADAPGDAPVVAVPVVACRLAMARMSPVFTSITTAVPL